MSFIAETAHTCRVKVSAPELNALVSLLQGAMSSERATRKASEEHLVSCRYSKGHPVALFQVWRRMQLPESFYHPPSRGASKLSLPSCDSLEPTQLMLVPLTPVQVLNAGQVDMSVRQMAAITQNNLCSTAWDPTETGSLRLHEEDKTTVRGALLGALLQLPPNLRSQLTEVAKSVIYSDYPDKVIKARVCGCTKTKSDAYN